MERELELLYQSTWKQHYKRILRICIFRLHGSNKKYAEDCCQEVFRLFFETLQKGRNIENIGAWLSKVAYTEVIRWEKRNSHDLLVSPDEEQLSIEYDFIEEILKNKMSDEEVITLIADTLTEEEKVIFSACVLKKRKASDIAQELKISMNVLYKKTWKLKKKLSLLVPQAISRIEEKLLK